MADDDAPATALRGVRTTDDAGVRVIRDTGSQWLDGSEVGLLERMRSGLPLDSLSDELFATATSWPERYHLSPSRANVVRALDLPADAKVLEIGAGCGAITRYLGETCAVVDALEPTLARARVAAARTAELPGVTVFSGEVSDVPDEPVYDVVVVVGVLEYVGGGGRDRAPYLTFLEELRRRLRPGGQLVVAIENPLGVKYLAGAPEDHSGEVFHSVEGYPVDGPARTFNRRRLQELAADAGFASSYVLGAFPDYKLTRLVLDDRLLTQAQSLALHVPSFPSPDWVIDRPALVDEELLWGELVDAGVGAEFSNSLVLVARTGDDATPLWQPDRLAAYFSMRRRRAYQVAKSVELADGSPTVVSRLLSSGSGDGLSVLPYREPWQDGSSLVALATEQPERLDALVADWVRLLEERIAESSGMPMDVLPHNVHYVDGVARVIDDEWRAEDLTVGDVLRRGAVLLARDLSTRAPLSTWGQTTVTDLALRIAAAAGASMTAEDVTAALDQEAALQARVGGGAPGSEAYESIRAMVRERLTEQFAQPLEGRRAPSEWKRAAEEQQGAVEARDLLFATGHQLDDARAELAAARRRLGEVEKELHQVRHGERPIREDAGMLARRVARAVRRRLPGKG